MISTENLEQDNFCIFSAILVVDWQHKKQLQEVVKNWSRVKVFVLDMQRELASVHPRGSRVKIPHAETIYSCILLRRLLSLQNIHEK